MSLVESSVVLEDGIRAKWKNQTDEDLFDWKYLLPTRPSNALKEGRGWVKNYILRGLYSFYQNNSRIQIEDSDALSESGGFHFRISNNWRVLIKVMVVNKREWFDSTGFNYQFPQRVQTFEGSSLGLPYSEAMFVLESGDYVSIDIDAEFNNIAQFKVVMGGQTVFEKGAVDRIVNIDIQGVQKLILDRPRLVQGAQEFGGSGDLDGDGVIDRLDYDPNDPEVSTEAEYLRKQELIQEYQAKLTEGEEILEYDPEDRYGTLIKKDYPKDPPATLGYVIVVLVCLWIIYGRKSNE